ncbi:MAG: hypothetical protein AYL28_005520 [Candidatus Bathyarchaeota archaeon B23]|nr:MAG: hypothetical protein AYL28_005520 [Candidatus Bathyarchaeota archaeon B23]
MIATSVFASSVVGGLSSIYGAMLGGYLISLVEVWGSYILMKHLGLWIGAYRMIISLSLMSVILMFEPGGLASFIEKLRKRYGKQRRVRRR